MCQTFKPLPDARNLSLATAIFKPSMYSVTFYVILHSNFSLLSMEFEPSTDNIFRIIPHAFLVCPCMFVYYWIGCHFHLNYTKYPLFTLD